MAALNLITLDLTTGKQKRVATNTQQVDFLSIRIGSDNLVIQDTGGVFDFGAVRLSNIGTPTAGTDAATKTYADGKVAKTGDSMTGTLTFDGTHTVTGLPSPVNPTDVPTKAYVDNAIQSTTWKNIVRSATTAALPAYVYANGTAGVGATLTGPGIANPSSAPTLATATTGGTIAAGTYFVKYTYVTAAGETAGSPEASLATTGTTSTLTVTFGTIPAGVSSVKIYASTATGTETLQTTVSTGTSVTLTSYATGGAAIPTSNTSYAALPAQDGVTMAANDRLLVKNETGANQPYNGIMDVTQVGSSTTAWVLTRSLDMDDAAEFNGATVEIGQEATSQKGETWRQTATSVTVGTTNISFIETNNGQTYTFANGVYVSGGTVSANPDGVTLDAAGATANGTTTLEVKAGGIGTTQLAAGGVTAAKLGTVTDGLTIDQLGTGSTIEVKAGGIGTTQLAASAVTAAKLGTVTDGVTLDQAGTGSTLEIKAGGVGTTQLAASAVTAAKLGAVTDGVTLDQAGTGSTLEIKAGGVGTTQLAAQAVTAAKLGAVTDGVTLTGGAGSNLAILETESGTNDNAGAITVRQIVYQKSNGNWDLAQATNNTLGQGTRFALVADASIATTAAGNLTTRHGALVAGFTGLTIGNPVYVSPGTGGAYVQDLTTFAAGNEVVRIGFAKTATTVVFQPEYLYQY